MNTADRGTGITDMMNAVLRLAVTIPGILDSSWSHKLILKET